jgi:ferredoxin
MARLKVKIDKEKCIGCGSCYSIAPEVFEMDIDGKAKISAQYSEVIIEDESLINKILNAKSMCPNQAVETEAIP